MSTFSNEMAHEGGGIKDMYENILKYIERYFIYKMVVYNILYGNWVKSHKVDLALAYNILMGIDFIVFLMDRVSSVLPNPDESLRIEMSTRIGRKPNQIQNGKLNYMHRSDENDKLRSEISEMQTAMKNCMCLQCRVQLSSQEGEEQLLLSNNGSIKTEINKCKEIITSQLGRSFAETNWMQLYLLGIDNFVSSNTSMNIGLLPQRQPKPQQLLPVCGLISSSDKALLVEQATNAMQELEELSGSTDQYWNPTRLKFKLFQIKSVENLGLTESFFPITSVWLPFSTERIFSFFKDESKRDLWDILSIGSIMQPVTNLFTGFNVGDRILLLQAVTSDANLMLLMQETRTDSSVSMLVFASIDSSIMQIVMSGGETRNIPLFSSGVAILPSCTLSVSMVPSSSSNPIIAGSFVRFR